MGTTTSHTWHTRQVIEICADCLHCSHSGAPDYDGYTDTGHAERYANAVTVWGDEPVNTDETEHFSHAPCDFCGDVLSGGRWVCSVMQTHRA